MRRITVWLLITAVTFALGVGVAVFYIKSRSLHEQRSLLIVKQPETVNFCDLVVNPNEYDGRFIRVNAPFFRGIHGSSFHDMKCGGFESQTGVTFTNETVDESQKIIDAAPGDMWFKKLNIIATGTFYKVTPNRMSDRVADNTSYIFKIKIIESATERTD